MPSREKLSEEKITTLRKLTMAALGRGEERKRGRGIGKVKDLNGVIVI